MGDPVEDAVPDQDYATVSGLKVKREDFAYAPPGSSPSEWKLPIHDASHVRNALARYNQTDVPASEKEGVWRKIVAAAKKFGIEVSAEKSSDVGARHGLPVLLMSRSLRLALTEPVTVDGKELHEHSIAIAGTWVKNGKEFSITANDLQAIARNFQKRKNEMVTLDYEHASEMPEVARGGPVPASGWIHSLFVTDTGGTPVLRALVEWTPRAKQLIASGEYRFFSPAIDFGACDKETGEAQGATLTSGALTNHPFLEELPAITLCDRELCQAGGSGTHLDGFMQGPAPSGAGKGAKMKFSIVKKLAGRRSVVGDDGAELGDFSLDDLALDDSELEHLVAKRNPGAVKLREMGEKAQLFSECVREGAIDLDFAAALADDQKVGIRDYRQIQKASELVEKAIVEGKFAPADREYISRVALADVARFEEWTKKKPRAVPIGPPRGVSGPVETSTPDAELALRLSTLMADGKLDRKVALERLGKEDPELVQRYRRGSGRIQ